MYLLLLLLIEFECFRLVAATENGMYLWLDDMYSRANLSTFNYTEKGVGNVSMLDVYLKNKHLKKDMIVRYVPRWAGDTVKLC